MRRHIQWILFSFLAITLAACNSGTPPNSAVNVTDIAVTPSPVSPDKATIIGRVISSKSNGPLSTTVRLAEVIRQDGKAVIALDGANSPGATTNQDGTFAINNVDAKEYGIVVGDVYGDYVIIGEGTEGKTRLWDMKAGQVTNLGELRVNL